LSALALQQQQHNISRFTEGIVHLLGHLLDTSVDPLCHRQLLPCSNSNSNTTSADFTEGQNGFVETLLGDFL